MFEPTETESLEGLNRTIAALKELVSTDPAVLHAAPQRTARTRVDEVRAARQLRLNYFH